MNDGILQGEVSGENRAVMIGRARKAAERYFGTERPIEIRLQMERIERTVIDSAGTPVAINFAAEFTAWPQVDDSPTPGDI